MVYSTHKYTASFNHTQLIICNAKLPLLENLIEKDKYQVLLCSSPANIMVGFAVHTWFLINRKGKLTRWEVIHLKKDREGSIGYLNKDYTDCFRYDKIKMTYSVI